MKKTFLVISSICSLFFISCASKNIPQEEEVIEAPEKTEEADTQEDFEENQESDDTESQNENLEFEDDEVELIEESVILPEPEDFEEPVVITLPPEDFYDEENIETPSTDETDQFIPEEEVEIEVIPEISDDKDANIESIDEENQNSEDEVKFAADEQDSDNDIEIGDDDSYSNYDVISVGDGEEGSVVEEESQDELSQDSEEIIPSRKVTMKKMEYLDVVYPGNGWIYMGITDGSKSLTYYGRKLGTENTTFSLQARNAGKKIIHFYKNDALTGQYLDDYIEVEILNKSGSNKTHITAPEYKQPLPKKAKELIENSEENKQVYIDSEKVIENDQSSVNTESSALNTDSSPSINETSTNNNQKLVKKAKNLPENQDDLQTKNELSATSSSENTYINVSSVNSDVLLQEAQVLYNEKEYKLALDKINSFFENATSKIDQGLYLKGQILESKSEVQDIKAAIEAYTTLTKNYPASKCWDNANKRIIYLKRFYLEVR